MDYPGRTVILSEKNEMIVCDAASEGQVLRGTGKKLILEEDRTIGTPVSHLEEEEEEGKIRLVSRKKRAKDSQTDISRLERKRTSDDRYRDNKATYVYIYIYIYIYVYVYTCTHIRARWSASKPKTYCAFHDDARRFKRAKRAKQRERKDFLSSLELLFEAFFAVLFFNRSDRAEERRRRRRRRIHHFYTMN